MTQRLAFIVEDSVDLAEIFAEALMAAGFTTEIIARGDRALARLVTTVPDIVLLDMHLPGASGERILRRIRADERLAKTRVMIASADDAIAEGLREQVDLTLLKPISYTQLRDLAARLLKEMDDAQ